MGSLKTKLKHAFAVDAPGPAEPTSQQQVPVDWLCRQVARRHLTTPGLIALEMCRPLNWIFAQGLHISQPAVWAVTPSALYEHYRDFSDFLERRGAMEHLCRRLEHFEQEYEAVERNTERPGSAAGTIDAQSPSPAGDETETDQREDQ